MRIFIDEAGRGPLAGPLFVGLVMELGDFEFEQVDELFQDSKALSQNKRELSYQKLQQMQESGLLIATGCASAMEIDRFGVTRAINIAIIRGLYQLFFAYWHKKPKRKLTFEQVYTKISDWMHAEGISLLIDGKMDFWLRKELNVQVETLVKWDAKIRGIAMASILAKVERDLLMTEIATLYPDWWFAKHKGYGTKSHYAAIAEFGLSNQHRKLFLKSLFPDLQLEHFDWTMEFSEKPLI